MSFATWDTHLSIFDHQFDHKIFFTLQQHQIISQVHKTPQSPQNLKTASLRVHFRIATTTKRCTQIEKED
jgi:hypothetical protein